MSATFVIDADNIREVLETDYPELKGRKLEDAVEAVMGAIESGADLYALAEHLIEQAGVEIADFTEDEDE